MSNRYYNNQKLLISSLWVVAGVALCAASFAGKLPSDMWSGMGGGLIGVGIVQIIRNLKYRSNPEYQQKIDIAANDERNRYLRMMAWSWTGYIFVIASAVISLILLIMGEKTISQILGLCMCAELVIYCVSYLAVGKKY